MKAKKAIRKSEREPLREEDLSIRVVDDTSLHLSEEELVAIVGGQTSSARVSNLPGDSLTEN